MSAIKLVLTDFDGTVAQMGKHIVSEAVREAVIACEESGVRMVPV
jgi:hydroxymethylpyrimidine pyrophosphatase-like HAD family hydrolase